MKIEIYNRTYCHTSLSRRMKLMFLVSPYDALLTLGPWVLVVKTTTKVTKEDADSLAYHAIADLRVTPTRRKPIYFSTYKKALQALCQIERAEAYYQLMGRHSTMWTLNDITAPKWISDVNSI